MEIWQILQEPWALRALAASTMVGVTCGMLGTFIVLRNMSLIGDALSHAILPGVVVAFAILGYNTLGFFFGSVAAGILSAVAITWIQQHVRTKNDAVIGIVFTAMFSIGVIGISSISRTGVHLDLKDFLFGNVLGVSNDDLWMTGMVMVLVAGSCIILFRYLFASTFQPTIASTMGIPVKSIHYYLMLLLSFAVVAAMQTVGVILVVAMLITPASTALLLAQRLSKVVWIAAVAGFISSLSGLILSILYEMPPGPAIAVMATVLYLVAAFFSPQQGLITRWLRSQQQKQKIRLEDILKAIYKIELHQPADLTTLAGKMSVALSRLKTDVQHLLKRNLLSKGPGTTLVLTERGKEQANHLIRAHRLWESYLVHEMGMDPDHIHDEAERYEHILSAEEIDEMDHQLGYPALDPHGSPIPSKETSPSLALDRLSIRETGRIAQRQPGAQIAHQLWDLGLGPGDEFIVDQLDTDVRIRVKDQVIFIPGDMARMISVERTEG